MLQIVEGGFNTKEINSAFDYDIVSSSEDESVISRITSSDESESSSENESVSVIPPTPRKRKINKFVKINNSNIVTTCTKCVHQHVQGASGPSGTNQSNSSICDLSEQPSLNTVSTDNTSHYQVTGQLDHSVEHDQVPVLNTQAEPVFIIPLDTELTPELLDEESNFQLQHNQLSEENTTTLQTPIIPIEDSASNSPHPPCHEQNDHNDNLGIPSDDEYYIVEYDHPCSPPTIQLQTTQIVNCEGDTELQEDLDNGLHRITHHVLANNPQFTDIPGLNFETNSHKPEVFFNQLFDNRMFTIMAEETNNYAHQQITRIMGGRDQIQQIEDYSHKRHARLGMWRDVNESDIKIFIAHILIMSSVRKPALHNYWLTKPLSRTQFFGTYLSRNKFQDILLNLHVADTTNNPPLGMPNHNPLAKVHPLTTMCQNNFRLRYTPSEFLAVDESTLAFKVKYTIFLKITLILI